VYVNEKLNALPTG